MKAESFVSYLEALEWLHGLLRFGQKPGLERMHWMLAELEHPERKVSFVHVAGTNGKGSTCAYLTQVLMEAGYSVGTFTSPYLVDFRERIRMNGQMIPENDLLALVNELKPLVDRCAAESSYGSPTEFEVITLLAIMYFANVARPSVVVWETGLGGRLDSTNVVFPLISVITNVGMDHTDVLGHTIEEIAREKAGIIKPGVPVVLGDKNEATVEVIKKIAAQKRSSLYRTGYEFTVEPLAEKAGLDGQSFLYKSVYRRAHSEYRLQMLGEHQVENAGVALMVIDLLRQFYAYLIEEEEMAKGLQQTKWPGRMEMVSRYPLVILDGAHNAEGMKSLESSLAQLLDDGSSVNLLLSSLGDKPLTEMANVWQATDVKLEHIYITSFDFPRAASAEMLYNQFVLNGLDSNQLTKIDDWSLFLREWMSDEEKKEKVLVICGSLYFIAQVRAFFPIPVEEAGE